MSGDSGEARPGGAGRGVLLATSLGEASGAAAAAAAVGVAAETQAELGGLPGGVLFADLGAPSRRPTLLASTSARELEAKLEAAGLGAAAARGHLCHLALPASRDAVDALAEALPDLPVRAAVAHLPVVLWWEVLGHPRLPSAAALLRAELPRDRSLCALTVGELRERGLRAKVLTRPLGHVAARRALAGTEIGGAAGVRAARLARFLLRTGGEGGQALIAVIAAAAAILAAALALAAIVGAVTGKGRAQRAADLAALSAARSMRDDFARLFVPAPLAGRRANPESLGTGQYLAQAEAAAKEAAERNGVSASRVRVSFPDSGGATPLRARVRIVGELRLAVGGEREAGGEVREVTASAEAEALPDPSATGMPATASGGGYSGPLEYRQGKPMRPDVAGAFDRLSAAARRAGIALVINSAFRSDAEQARLFAANPDPRWVAPPGRSLHRCGTELDLGPPAAYGWLAANARRFGFLKRYPWEPWHYGYVRGPAPCSPAGAFAGRTGDGRLAASAALPYVPARFRAPIERAAARWNVSAGLLAAQLMAESGFDPRAVSPAGAQGIAQFMPDTARAYGLRDPFHAPAAIHAQARLMADLLSRFGSIPLALAAYNAGPGAVESCGCVPEYPETQAYVARILGLLGGAGELALRALEVRLVA